LGQDGAATNNYRLIDNRDFEQIKNDNGGSTTTATATAQLQSSDVSTPVTINDAQIQQEVQEITDLSRTNEHQTDIVLNKNTAEVTAVRGVPGVSGKANVDVRTTASGATLGSDGGLFLANVHGHNLSQNPNEVNITGTSTQDKTSATSEPKVTIYATDAYNTKVGASATIGRVTSDGVPSNNVGQTKGAGSGTFNIGLDALNSLPR
jgi:hypothetical protein